MGFRELPYESQKSLHIHSALFWLSLKFNFKAAPCYVYGLASLTFIHFSLLIWQVTISCNSSRSCFRPSLPLSLILPTRIVINVFSDKKKNPTPSLSCLYQSFTSLSHRSRKPERCADDDRFKRVETDRAFRRHARGLPVALFIFWFDLISPALTAFFRHFFAHHVLIKSRFR